MSKSNTISYPFTASTGEIYCDFKPDSDKVSKFLNQSDVNQNRLFAIIPRSEVEVIFEAMIGKNRSKIAGHSDEELAATADYKFSNNEPEQTDHEQTKQESPPKQNPSMLQRLLDKEQAVSQAATKPIVFTPSLISRHDTGIFGRGTVNVIQGPFGSHKSRLAEMFTALMLTRDDTHDPQFLEFKKAVLERFCACYIDTERNQREELPFAIQGIKQRAGYHIDEAPENFRFTSIKGEDRKDRFKAIETFIHHVREQTTLHLFCLIDVITDAIGDFNDPKESMKLFDFLGNLCDNYNATFLLVIHQNPGTEKARGHTGTEAANKASSVLQIGFEKDANNNDTELIKLRFLKLRRAKRPEPIFLQFCQESNGLRLANADAIAGHSNQRKYKADTEGIADRLLSLLSEGPLPKNEVWTVLGEEFKAGNATIRERLKTIMETNPAMYNEAGISVRLADYNEGRNQFFKLVPTT